MQGVLQQAQPGDHLLFLDDVQGEWYSGVVQTRTDLSLEVRSTDKRLAEGRMLYRFAQACLVPEDLLRGELTIYGVREVLERNYGLPLAARVQILERRTILQENYLH